MAPPGWMVLPCWANQSVCSGQSGDEVLLQCLHPAGIAVGLPAGEQHAGAAQNMPRGASL